MGGEDRGSKRSPRVPTVEGLVPWFSGTLFVNMFISFCGAGMLGLPYAFKMAGVVEGIFLMCLISAISIYAMLLLVEAKYRLCKDEQDDSNRFFSYADMGEAAMGRTGRLLVEWVLTVAHVGFCCAYLIFISKTMETITPGTAWQLSQYFDFDIQESSAWVIFLSPMLVPLMLLPFDKLHTTSLVADVATLISYGIVYYVDFDRLSHMKTSAVVSYMRFRGIPFFASVAMYCYEGAGLVLSLEHSSYSGKSREERRRYFPKMFIFSLVVITACYILFGVLGYAAFGEGVQAVITKNLGPGVLSYSIKGALSLALFLTYPVVIHPIGQILDSKFDNKRFVLIRVLMVLLTVFIVICIPSFSFVMELIGGSACAAISFVMPAIFHMKVMSKELTPWARRIDQFIIIFGTGIGIVCTVVVFSDLFVGSDVHQEASVLVQNVSSAISALNLSDLEQAG